MPRGTSITLDDETFEKMCELGRRDGYKTAYHSAEHLIREAVERGVSGVEKRRRREPQNAIQQDLISCLVERCNHPPTTYLVRWEEQFETDVLDVDLVQFAVCDLHRGSGKVSVRVRK